MSTWPAVSFCLCCFDRLWYVCCPYICPGSPVTWTSTLVRTSTWPAVSFCLCCFDRSWYVCGPYTCPGSPIMWTSTLVGMSTWPAVSFCLCCFDRSWYVCCPYICPGSPVTWTSTLVGTSTWPAGSFCLCCFWQTVRHLWSLHVSEIPRDMDLHPRRKVYLTSWFMLSVLFLTGSETSRRPTPWQECLPDQLVHSVCVVFDRWWDICGPYMVSGYPVTRTSTLVETCT